MKKLPLVTVILINYNHSKDTIKCVESVLKSEYNNFHVFIIDNGSEEQDYKKLIEIYENNEIVSIIHLTKNLGYVGGVNKGLEEAAKIEPDFFLIMNNDTIIDKDAMHALVETAEKYGGNAIVSGKVYNMDKPDTLQYIGQWCRNRKKIDFPPYVKDGQEKDLGQYDNEMEMAMLDDIYWLLPNKVFRDVGYYSNYFFLYGEQNDYALRAVKKGYKLIYSPNAKIWHYHHLTTADGKKESPSIDYWKAYALLMLQYLHCKRKYFLIFYFKNLIKLLATPFFCKSQVKNLKPQLFAYIFFTKWIFNKTPNDGFNPFIKKVRQ